MRPLSFIQVGIANRGTTILKELIKDSTRFKPVGLVDLVPNSLEEARKLTGLDSSNTYLGLKLALAAQPQSEAVFIATPARFHGALVREALLAGKHVWVEKPLTYDYKEALELARLAKKQKRVVVVGNQYQYDPLERRLQKLTQSGQYGKPFLVSYTHHRHRPTMASFTGEYPSLWEQGVHSLDSILAILKHPPLKSVYTLHQRPENSNYNHSTIINVLTQFGGGIQASLLVSFDSHRSDWEIRVECTKAAFLLKANGWSRSSIEILQNENVIETVGPVETANDGMDNTYSAFYAQVTTGRPAPTSIEINLKTLEWIDAAVRSGQNHSIVVFENGL
jgi:predicted dehydrogenase